MALNTNRILEQIGYSREEFAREMNWTLDELSKYEKGELKLPAEQLITIIRITDLQPKDIQIDDSKEKFFKTKISPRNTWKPSRITQTSLLEYIKEGIENINETTCKTELERVKNCISTLRKPKISFAGQSDVGKSTLINALIGSEKMPAKWTPTTSIVVHIKHINDRPEFIKDNVWIFGKNNNEFWSDEKLNDEVYCKKFLVGKGDYSLLQTYGTHQSENNRNKEAFSAVTFIESDLLETCDILDLPGFAANLEDDALHKFNTQENETDILIYLSRSNGFLQDRDLDYLNLCLDALRPIERKGVNDLDKLENLFIIASQSKAVGNGNFKELQEILDRRCNAFCKLLRIASEENGEKSLLYKRSKITGYDYTNKDIRARFFTYERDITRLCERFNKSFQKTAEKLSQSIYKDFSQKLGAIYGSSIETIKSKINEYKLIMEEREKYIKLLTAIKENEPLRKSQQDESNKKVFFEITNLNTSTKQEIQTIYDEFMNVESLITLIDKNNYKNNKSDKEQFSSLVSKILKDRIQLVIENKSNDFSKILDEYLKEYDNRFKKLLNLGLEKDIDLNFDTVTLFATSIASIGVAGAAGIWLTTSFTSMIVTSLGAYAGLGSIIAFGGVITIAVGAVIAAVISALRIFSWKKDLCEAIINSYKSEEYITKIFSEVDKYWNDTKKAFELSVKHIEDEWNKKINEYENLADEENLSQLENNLKDARDGLDFFMNMPLVKS
ncbi:helix-turn-helix domain-containing protein [Romboutsia sp. 1001713B170131_170501_G6]|uniref:helix-turn-helix domain-containing protein n=1 Tax=Romboutsia sp. 1001713B170131_170501_G6 TaxID=2787108 RepID=UPI0018A8CB8E|nr:helix-turn-helix transcriptional regulator [Romboutsia sp. 1001713B170131_170501_G6]